MHQVFQVSHPKKEGVLQASKWFSYRVLIDEAEMESLLTSLPPFSFYNVSEIVNSQTATFSKKEFLKEYKTYIRGLKEGNVCPLPKALFSSAMSATPEAFYAMDVKKGIILKLLKPVIQLSLHHFTYSPQDHSFHFMVHSQESVSWGIQLSYPQLCANSMQGDVTEVMKDRLFPNTILFREIMKWMRSHSRPTPFLIEGIRMNVEARLGNQCFEWIHKHPTLREKNLIVQRVGQ